MSIGKGFARLTPGAARRPVAPRAAFMRKILLGFLLVLVVGTGVYLRSRRKKQPVEVDYAANREVTLWSTTAAVRRPVATVPYGARLEVLSRFEDQVQVRAASGVAGWTEQSNLLTPDFWETAQKLDASTAKLPVEARGHTAVLANLHIAPDRDAPRIRQLQKLVPVEMFERRAVDVPRAAGRANAHGQTVGGPEPARREDWWLVRAQLADNATVSGWLLGRFVTLDVPEALYDYASAADIRVVAWFELDRVADADGNPRPQYLVAGTRGPEGQPCDFTLLRVYTWSKKRQRYETAFVQSGVCGALPVQIKRMSRDEVTFSFEDRSNGEPKQAVYRMHQTIVRREREAGRAPASGKRIHG
jgi:hypothetical protein